MLQIQHISKTYQTEQLAQSALDDVSFNLRDNEFVAVLGPSGSGKTTLLNVIGGLDRYDSGNLIINRISTKDYDDRDWDSYRNHTVGFIFQSYNLISHQSVLSNVEIALTISGVSKSERRKRAKETLERVGLKDHMHKRPNQLSGGQMQRVAIARALINNPDILLADEPTGALDTETSAQVLALLKEVAKDRLVVLVTHNRELADQYANRIIKLRDGKITHDSNPYEIQEDKLTPPKHENMGKASMSFFTALSLSFNNLRSKLGRTTLTAFAGSIGIIGIALILSLASGVNNYIETIQRDTMTAYPITIDAQAFDLSSLLDARDEAHNTEITHDLSGVYSNTTGLQMASSFSTSILTYNNLTAFKAYLDDPNSEIAQYLGENGVIYSYDLQYDVYATDPSGVLLNTDGSTLEALSSIDSSSALSGFSGISGGMSAFSNSSDSSEFEELIPGQNGQLVSAVIMENYDVLYGSWPDEYSDVVLVLDDNNEISAATLYNLGFLPSQDYVALMEKIQSGEELSLDTQKLSYEEIVGQTFVLVPACDYFVEDSNGLFIQLDSESLDAAFNNAIPLTISGIVRRAADANSVVISGTVGYTAALTEKIISHTNESAVVTAQLTTPEIDVLTGLKFTASGSGYNDNMAAFGIVALDAPVSISLYADSFEDKDSITETIALYNETADQADQITYTDYVGLIMSSVTTIINVISYVLIAFVAVSLIVSSIMIGIITYISVLERTKEIGILRAIGSSKKNISQVFSAETFIIGLFAGIIGVGITCLLLIPGNAIIHTLIGSASVNAALPPVSAIILILLSMCLTLIAGIIPSRKAAKKDPVTALRTE